MKACNNYQMKKSTIMQMLVDDGRERDAKDPAVIKAYIADTALYPATEKDLADGWGIGAYEKGGQHYILDFKDQH